MTVYYAHPTSTVSGMVLAPMICPVRVLVGVVARMEMESSSVKQGLHSSASKLSVSTFHWKSWVVSATNTAEGELRSGRV